MFHIIRQYLSQGILKIIYYALVVSEIRYEIDAWVGTRSTRAEYGKYKNR